MRIGILADIHEDILGLRNSLHRLKDFNVDQIVVLGDIFDTGNLMDETVQLLDNSKVIGVFGNHDLGFCHEPDESVLCKYSNQVRHYMAQLTSRLQIEDFLFCHGLPHWDATDPVIYYLAKGPEEEGEVHACFQSARCRIIFVGHFHRWFVATEHARLSWQGESPITLTSTNRFLVVVGAVCDGWCAVYDTATHLFTPIFLSEIRLE